MTLGNFLRWFLEYVCKYCSQLYITFCNITSSNDINCTTTIPNTFDIVGDQIVHNSVKDLTRCPVINKNFITVLFADIVGFTEISSKLESFKVKDLLDRWFRTLEIIADDFNIHEIDTIGDSFIGATNVFQDQDDHAARMAKFGICAIKAAELTRIDIGNFAHGNLSLRIGIHSGPCTASVVGLRHPKFTLFGDTVNTASRMESTSKPGKIQCSHNTAYLIGIQDPGILIKKRGVINVKGKGFMKTYWIERTCVYSLLNVDSSDRGGRRKNSLQNSTVNKESSFTVQNDWNI